MPNEKENENPVANNNQFEPRSFQNDPSQNQQFPSEQPIETSPSVPFEVEPPTSSLGETSVAPAPAATSFGVPSNDVQDGGAPDVQAAPAAVNPAAFGGTLDAPSTNSGLNVAPKKSKKRLVVVGVVAAVLALLIAGGVAAYALWYQNPDKVIGDALGNALSSESAQTDSQLTVKSGTGASATTYDVKIKTVNDLKDARVDMSLASDAEGASFDISGSMIVKSNEKLYLKIDKLKELLEKSGLQMYLGSSPSVTSLIDKLDSNWVVVTKDELEENTGTKDEASKCVEDVMQKLRTDEAYSNDVETLYKKYPLIGVKNKLGSKDGSLGYEIEFKRNNAIQFANGLNSTKFYADLKKCDDKIEDLDGEEMFKQEAGDDDSDAKVVVWIDRWTHQFTKFEVTGSSDDSKMTLTTNVQFDKPIVVEEPKDPITVDELKSDIEAIQQEMMQASEASMNASIQESERLNQEMDTKGTLRRS